MAMSADCPGWLDGNLQPPQPHNLQALGVGAAKPADDTHECTVHRNVLGGCKAFLGLWPRSSRRIANGVQ